MGKFGHKGSRNAAEVYVVVWHESYRYNVVGESFHRPELRQIIAASSDDERDKGEIYTVAVLQREPTNEYDKNAVRVLIGGEMVGHVPREDTPALGKMVAMVEGSGGHCGARAVIGWSGSPSDAPIGVRLDLPNPDRGGTEIVLRPLSELAQPAPVPMPEPMTAPALMINAQPDQPESVSDTEPRQMIQSTPRAEPAIPTGPVRTFTGYGVVAEFDGATLRAHDTNKATHFALAGANHDEEVVVPVSTIISVEMKDAGRVGNGNLVVQTGNGSRYQLHFLRKHQADFDALATGLRGEPAPEVPPVVESVPMPALLDLPPAAWYPNLEGPGQRYWNGQLWTEDYAP